jgi:hypothetical protein
MIENLVSNSIISMRVLKKYFGANKLFLTFVGYFLFAAILKMTFRIDVCIPCIWKLVFGIRCPGCGITTAFINLMKLDFLNAFQSNWLIIIVVPFLTYYSIQDFCQFSRKQKRLIKS